MYSYVVVIAQSVFCFVLFFLPSGWFCCHLCFILELFIFRFCTPIISMIASTPLKAYRMYISQAVNKMLLFY